MKKEELKKLIAQFLEETREKRLVRQTTHNDFSSREPKWDDFIDWLGLSE